jgi:hypothetical protein
MQKNNQVMIDIIAASIEKSEAAQARAFSAIGILVGLVLLFFAIGIALQITGALLIVAGILGIVTQAIKEQNAKKAIENLKNKLEP